MAMSERKEGWFRIIVYIVSGIVLGVWQIFILVISLINWLITIFSGKRNKDLADLSEYWNTEMYKFYRYLTFVSNVRPFPFTRAEKISEFDSGKKEGNSKWQIKKVKKKGRK